VESPFFHGDEPERRVRMRPAAMGNVAFKMICGLKLTHY
jgi:hypothetical protein